MEDLLEDFDDSVAGFTDRNFGESLAYVYDEYGVLVGNALLPVYAAIERCEASRLASVNDLASFLSSPEWIKVMEWAQIAFDIVDAAVAKDDQGSLIQYEPDECTPRAPGSGEW